MSDLINWLREGVHGKSVTLTDGLLNSRLHEAADQLEAHQAEIARLREALEPFAEASLHLHPSHADGSLTLDGIKVKHWRAARAALEQKP